MPRYEPLPYVREPRRRDLRLADLYLRQGEIQADAERRRGDIQAQLWGNVGSAVGQMGSALIEAPNKRREQDRLEAESKIRREMGEIQVGEARRGINDRENLDLAMTAGSRQKTLEALKDRPELYEKAQGHFSKIDASLKQLLTDTAAGIADFGYTPEAANAALDDLEENGFDPAKLKQFREAFQNPDQIRPIVDRMLGVQPKPLMAVPDSSRVLNQDTGEVVLPSVPRPEPQPPVRSIEQQIADALAKGDTETVKRLTKAAELASDARRAPTAPTPQRAPIWVIGADGEFQDLAGVAPPGSKPSSTRDQGRAVTSGDAGRIADFDTSMDDLAVLSSALASSGSTGTSAKVGASMPDWVTEYTGWGSDAKKKQALIDRVKQVIGKALEAGVLRKEDEIKYEKILPTVGNPNEIVISKLQGLSDAIKLRRERTLEALADAGYDTSRFVARGAEQNGPKEGDKKPIDGYPGTEQTFIKGKWIRTK